MFWNRVSPDVFPYLGYLTHHSAGILTTIPKLLSIYPIISPWYCHSFLWNFTIQWTSCYWCSQSMLYWSIENGIPMKYPHELASSTSDWGRQHVSSSRSKDIACQRGWHVTVEQNNPVFGKEQVLTLNEFWSQHEVHRLFVMMWWLWWCNAFCHPYVALAVVIVVHEV